jgi:hypothetical protein
MLLEESVTLRGTTMSRIGGFIENNVRMRVQYSKGSLDMFPRKKYFEVEREEFDINLMKLQVSVLPQKKILLP